MSTEWRYSKSGSRAPSRCASWNQSHRRSDDPPKNAQDHAGWSIDSQIEVLVRAGVVSSDIAITHAMDPRALAKKLGISER